MSKQRRSLVCFTRRAFEREELTVTECVSRQWRRVRQKENEGGWVGEENGSRDDDDDFHE